MKFYPVLLDLRGKRCLIVVGGEAATRIVAAMVNAGACLTVISPEVTLAIKEYRRKKKLRHLKRRYQEGDLKGFFLVYAATCVSEIDLLVATEATMQGILLNVVKHTVLCSFIDPPLVQGRHRSIVRETLTTRSP